jgi:hypothetical protein
MAERIAIDLEEGYRPHFVAAFLVRYGASSLFVRAAADCLTARHVVVLMKAGRLGADAEPRRIGSRAALASLEFLLGRMKADGAAENMLHILREATGVKEPGVLEAEVDQLYGQGAFIAWLALFEQRQFNLAAARLRVLH